MAPSTPTSVRNGAFSPPLSSAASYTTSGQSKLNIVSRLAIEGKAKQTSDGASIKLYLKLTVPVDSVTPGQILPLFAEENVKIRDYQFVFSSTTNPLLHNTARALNLPARSTKSYLSLFESASQSSPGRNNSVNGSRVQRLLRAPKEFPPQFKMRANGTDSVASIGERNSIQFMAGLALWVPFSSKPPRAPYMLSIPIPRCLSNTIKVRLPSPAPVSTSFASLSSDEDSGGWDLATEPHVTRTSKHGSRMSAYNEFADDESSEASLAGASENCLIRGTFTSSDLIRIRWANPMKIQDFPDQGDGRRRVGVAEVKGNMTCTVLAQLEEGVKMRLDYQGACTGVWFPGVAIMLGMDVGLDAHGCHLTWPDDSDGRWNVDGDTALTGFSVGLPRNPLSRENSLELPQLTIRETRDTSGLLSGEAPPNGPPRPSSRSSASLLRAPLPQQAVPEYSFEDSMTPTTSGLPSSVPSITTSMTRSSFGLSTASENTPYPPSTPITIHLDMSELLPSTKNKFTFNISGTVIVSRIPGIHDSQESSSMDSETLPLPLFRVFSAESESISTVVRNQCDSTHVEVLGSTNSLMNNRGKKTIVPNGSQVKCGLEGSEILVKPIAPKPPVKMEEQASSIREHRASIAATSRPSSPELLMSALQRSQRSERSVVFRDGPLLIPWVSTDVVPVSLAKGANTWSYAVTFSLPTPVDVPSEWLEFGLSLPPELSSLGSSPLPKVEVSCASVNGVPVRFETFGQSKSGAVDLSTAPADPSKRRWLSWIRVHIALAGALEVVYIVTGQPNERAERNGKSKTNTRRHDVVNVFLPVFSIPVSRFEISLRRSSDVTVESGTPNNSDQSLYRKISRFNVEPLSSSDFMMPHPFFSAKIKSSSLRKNTRRILPALLTSLPYLFSVVLLNHTIGMRMEMRELKAIVPGNWSDIHSAPPASGQEARTEVLTVTSTRTVSICQPTSSSSSERRWFGDTYTVSYSPPTQTRKVEQPTPPPPQKEPIIEAEENDEVLVEDAPESPRETTRNSDRGQDSQPSSESKSIIPLLYLPLSWPVHYHYEHAKAQVMGGWGRVWRVVEVILHWPLPVDADM
ncbi:hypothetical protein DFH11DRAFT_1579142 [Phellopilus nigrolimitatus]|nr:hypothetical protein DFH11DRAFT_1579142 [Phellopilus nigrolimitatus]